MSDLEVFYIELDQVIQRHHQARVRVLKEYFRLKNSVRKTFFSEEFQRSEARQHKKHITWIEQHPPTIVKFKVRENGVDVFLTETCLVSAEEDEFINKWVYSLTRTASGWKIDKRKLSGSYDW